MCGFVGFSNLKNNISSNFAVLKDMTSTLQKRGPDEEGFFTKESILLGHKRLIIVDADNGKQPMSTTYQDNTYTIVYNGQLYNTEDIRKELINKRF